MVQLGTFVHPGGRDAVNSVSITPPRSERTVPVASPAVMVTSASRTVIEVNDRHPRTLVNRNGLVKLPQGARVAEQRRRDAWRIIQG